MKAAIISVVGLLSLAIGARAQDNCGAPAYTENIVPKCLANKQIMMPNYADVSTYYTCSQTNTPELAKCATKTPYFTYVMQSCTTCSDYIPAVPCSRLTVGLDCQAIEGGGVTTAPGSTTPGTTAEPTTKASTTAKTTTTKTTTPAGPSEESTTTPSPDAPGGTTVYVPMPPSPNEGPTPPGPDPTVPNLPSGPPVSNN
ncbi:hypothetical protein ACLKA7_011133 [Drosophila subpalustris]